MTITELPEPPWPWRFDPGNLFNAVATHARIAAGFTIRTLGPSREEFLQNPELIGRDLTLVIVMALGIAKQAGVELDFEKLIATARVEADRLEAVGPETIGPSCSR